MKRFFLLFFGWTALLDIPIALFSAFVGFAYSAYIKYNPKEPQFELFLMDVLYDDMDDTYNYKSYPDEHEKLDIDWKINENDLYALSDVRMKITNNGGSFYAISNGGKNNFWIHSNYNTYHNDTIFESWDGMGCGTGNFYQYISTKQEIDYFWYFSIYDKLTWNNGHPGSASSNIDSLIDVTFGDSTEIYWTLSTFSTPWSQYVPQTVYSPSYMLYPDELKAAWKKVFVKASKTPASPTLLIRRY